VAATGQTGGAAAAELARRGAAVRAITRDPARGDGLPALGAEVVADDALAAALREAGVGDDYARGTAALYDALNGGRVVFEPGVGETRRGTVTLAEAVARTTAAHAAPAAP
jgi:uncharacterized protein YbjT (DUF2867 family)